MHTELFALPPNPWFTALPPHRQAILLREAREHRFGNGDLVYAMGDAPNGLWAVLEGQIRLKAYTSNGGELLALIIRPGGWFGELSTLDHGPRPHDAIAFGESRVLQVTMPAFARATAADPGLVLATCQLGCAHQRSVLDYVIHNLAQPVRIRLAKALVRSSRNEVGPINIRQHELAGIVGTSRQTLNRLLGQFAREGLIRIAYTKVEVVDRARLILIANPD